MKTSASMQLQPRFKNVFSNVYVRRVGLTFQAAYEIIVPSFEMLQNKDSKVQIAKSEHLAALYPTIIERQWGKNSAIPLHEERDLGLVLFS